MSSDLQLLSLELDLERRPGALLPQIRAALARRGEPLRWAITAAAGDRLRIEAIVLVAP